MAAPVADNPFAVLTLVAAPALLTNATSLLALSTINRILRTSDRMRALAAQLETGTAPAEKHRFLLAQVDRVERQSLLLLQALHSVYVALGCFAGASLVSILGACVAEATYQPLFRILVALGFLVGITGVGGLVWGSVKLFQATQISLQNIAEEAAIIRRREGGRGAVAPLPPPG